jgi:hypothetical protein
MEMVHQCGTTHAGQWDTRLYPGTRRSLWCNRSKVVVEVATLDILLVLTRPLQRDADILAARLRLSSARRSLDLSRETGVSLPARRRLSSARRSSVGAALTEGEHTDADASC